MTNIIIKQRIASAVSTIVMVCFGFTGFASADTMNTITNTGADSTNTIETTEENTCDITNNNDVDVTNTNEQTATSGSVDANENTTVGDVTSGDATNTSTVVLSVIIDNSSDQPPITANPITNDDPCAPAPASNQGGSIGNTGAGSTNVISSSARNLAGHSNNNFLRFNNRNHQFAGSGFVSSRANTSAGSVASGPASNASAPSVAATVASPSGGGMGGGSPTPAPNRVNSISNTGADSTNTISQSTSNTTSVTNYNNVSAASYNDQTANSGSVDANQNTTVGGAASGTAANASGVTEAVHLSS